ncbi:bifunctional [glutamine synthetase] adenylyltransferase/[glutamine synthetase]-adenylyl-L-tyrosine phosphorylase [Actinomyces oris]|uniref:Bifunctional glutamine-synthetase adenylyltransferase/deadenyltransferase n=1 Tax=Actinomyces oris TaxID=544580 RepID=A0A1Q8VAX1_9ACTO|nr:bifunctional [glutamine synthetase] adenylyltransferase/[glutamine synthetase]-adenylyl-L-tyrosine phosphorylase [Actinomyces oris]OLO45242.1 bifunctional glutamine-synthetase adenylyltransferase/deadenyltransferase [Actinomyces oris]
MRDRSKKRAPIGSPSRHSSSPRTVLLRAGFQNAARAGALLGDPALLPFLPAHAEADDVGEVGDPDGCASADRSKRPGSRPADVRLGPAREDLVSSLALTADPDMALLSLVRLAEAATAAESTHRASAGSVEPGCTTTPAALLRSILSDPAAEHREHRQRLLAVLGASQALGDFLVAHPERLTALAPLRAWSSLEEPSPSEALQRVVQEALGQAGPANAAPSDGGETTPQPGGTGQAVSRATAALRRAYRDRLTAIVADDLTSADPIEHVPTVCRRMAELADAALDAALLVARAAVGPQADEVALAVIAMGKTGARELNYISDVDVVYVVGPAHEPRSAHEPVSEEHLVDVGTHLATELAHVVSATAPEPPLWPLDTALRPEGKDGALVRTLDSHLAYYRRWAASWEFQALLKARACAGDTELGARYEQGVAPYVWEASRRENFVEDARAMRRRVEKESVPRGGEDRRIKLGPGGLRDVEFTVQLLQLVHGRSDESLRVRGTLEALDALSAGGYVSRTDAAAMSSCYKALRLLEHRSQLFRLRRTHNLPEKEENLRRIERGISGCLGRGDSLWEGFKDLRRRVRSLHQEIYYRPLLGFAAALSADEMALSPQAARERLAAVGYTDPDGALRHIQALTEGVSRRAAIQRQLLPVIIGWIGEGADPDFGLLSFRRLSEAIGGSHWYLAMLRDSPVAARRLCQVLSSAHWATERLAEFPESIAWLDDDDELELRRSGALAEEVAAVLRRRSLTGPDEATLAEQAIEAVQAILRVRAREEVRASLADCLDGIDPERTASILSDATDAVLEGALTVATGLVIAQRDGAEAVSVGPDASGRWQAALARHAIVAMGRLGGREIGYASDADVLFIHEARDGVDQDAAAQEAEAVAKQVMGLLASALPHPLEVDCDLRPEGRNGVMSRSLNAYREYYGRWSALWERQALLRARPCAGDRDLGRRFEELINPLRWAQEGLLPQDLREIRRIKARVEAERLPRGIDPARHLKLGPGGLSDVEWSAQVLQLAHAGRIPELRTTSTVGALQAAAQAGVLSADDGGELVAAWILASRLRSAIVLGTGRASGPRSQVLPIQIREIRLVGRLIGLGSGRERELEDLYRRSARHARAVAERIVFTDAAAHGSSAPTPSPTTSVAQQHSADSPPPHPTGRARNGRAQSRRGLGAAGSKSTSSKSSRQVRRNRVTRRRPEGPYPWS